MGLEGGVGAGGGLEKAHVGAAEAAGHVAHAHPVARGQGRVGQGLVFDGVDAGVEQRLADPWLRPWSAVCAVCPCQSKRFSRSVSSFAAVVGSSSHISVFARSCPVRLRQHSLQNGHVVVEIAGVFGAADGSLHSPVPRLDKLHLLLQHLHRPFDALEAEVDERRAALVDAVAGLGVAGLDAQIAGDGVGVAVVGDGELVDAVRLAAAEFCMSGSPSLLYLESARVIM